MNAFDYYKLTTEDDELLAVMKLPSDMIISTDGWIYVNDRYFDELIKKQAEHCWCNEETIEQVEFETYVAFGIKEIGLDYSMLGEGYEFDRRFTYG